MLTWVERATAFNARITLALSIFSLVVAMLVVSADAIFRKFAVTVPGAVSITELFIAGLVFGGIVYAQTANLHLHVGLLDNALSPFWKLATTLLGLLVGFISTAAIAWFGFLTALDSWEVHEIAESSINVPLWPSRLILALGCTLLGVQFVLDALRLVLTHETRHAEAALESAT